MSQIPKKAFKGVWMPKPLWQHKGISWMNKCLLAEIDALDDGGGCFASNEFLAQQFGTTSNSIKVVLCKLFQEGHLIRLEKPGQPRLMAVNAGLMAVNLKVNGRLPDGTPSYVHESTSESTPSSPNGSGEDSPKEEQPKKKNTPDPRFPLLVESFVQGFEEEFKTKYRFDGGKDGKAVKLLLEIAQPEEIMRVAKAAWSRRNNPNSFHFQRACTIHGLNTYWNNINADLNTVPKVPSIPPWKEKQQIEARIEVHPANPEWIKYDKNKVTDLLRSDLKRLRMRLEELKDV